MRYEEKNEAFDTASLVGNYLGIYFEKEQGVRLGESTVVSLKAHAQIPGRKGQIRILLNRDAGKTYRGYVDFGQVVHIDVFHRSGPVDVKLLAKNIFHSIETQLITMDKSLQFNENEKLKNILEYALKIEVTTRTGRGLVYEILQGDIQPISETEEKLSHVHILANFTREKYGAILPIVEAVEMTLEEEGLEPGKIKRIVHTKEKAKQEKLAGYLILPWKKQKGEYSPLLLRENQNHLLLKLAEKFASVEEMEEFMQSYSTNIFRRKSRDEQKRKVGELDEFLDQLEDLEILKRGLIGPILTKEGKELTKYLAQHKCDIEAEIRRSIRKSPGRSRHHQRMGKGERSPSRIEFTNRNKTLPLSGQSWSGDLAVPETIIQAKKASLLRGEKMLSIHKEDMRVYEKRSYVPIDVCLVIDASASMAGDKRQAACYLAEHLLLTGREKVAVVIFQQTKSRVVVPFTRNHKLLSAGLASIRPEGLTPMADGIFTGLKLVKSSRVTNPLMIMITDGMPNFPLWSVDAKEDALEAARMITKTKIKFVCIGLESNKVFLQEIACRARGTLYIVDDLNRNTLVDIVKYEKRLTTANPK